MKRIAVYAAVLGLGALVANGELFARGPRGGGGGGGGLGGGAARSGGFSGGGIGGAPRIGGGASGVGHSGAIGSGAIGSGAIGSRIGAAGGGQTLNRGGGPQGLTPGGRANWGDLRGSGALQGLTPGNRPALNLPGSGSGVGGTGRHWSPGDHGATLPGLSGHVDHQQWLSDHRQNLDQRLQNGLKNPGQWQQSRQDFLNQRREDWQSWLDHRYPYHHGWHGGYWHGYWDGYWGHLWHDYPVASAFAITAWGVNALGYGWGLYPYANPYWAPGTTVVYDYSQPVIADEGAQQDASAEPTQPGFSEFEQAREAFAQGDYAAAQRLADAALKALPNDAVIHEFRALCQFAQADYHGAAATLNSVLAVGPGWNWETLASLYPSVETYTAQLRALERYIDDHPDAGDARFVLAYHYLTTGAKDAAIGQLREVVRLVPKDMVAKQLLDMFSPAPATKTDTAPPSPGATIPVDKLHGTWKATSSDGARFELTLNPAGDFVWKYTRGDKVQQAKGAYALRGDTLALEPETGGVMLAQVTLQGTTGFVFKPIGGTNIPPVTFGR